MAMLNDLGSIISPSGGYVGGSFCSHLEQPTHLVPPVGDPSREGAWAPGDLSMDPDPQAETLLAVGMDISGSVLFDPDLLNMIKFD